MGSSLQKTTFLQELVPQRHSVFPVVTVDVLDLLLGELIWMSMLQHFLFFAAAAGNAGWRV
jgi:hypothetical protein